MRCCNAIVTTRPKMAAVACDGHLLGVGPQRVLLPETGSSVLQVFPLLHEYVPASCLLTLSGGTVQKVSPGQTLFDWGDLLELSIECSSVPKASKRLFPFTIARLQVENRMAILYYENGLWLSVEAGGRVLAGYPLGEDATSGELYAAGRMIVAIGHGAGDAALALNERAENILSLHADKITYADGLLESTENLPCQSGLQKRIVWTLGNGAVMAGKEETGYFTRKENADIALPMRFCEAMLYGREDLAVQMLDTELAQQMKPEELTEFLGTYSAVREHPAQAATVGLVQPQSTSLPNGEDVWPQESDTQILTVKKFQFEQNSGRIVNIVDES